VPVILLTLTVLAGLPKATSFVFSGWRLKQYLRQFSICYFPHQRYTACCTLRQVSSTICCMPSGQRCMVFILAKVLYEGCRFFNFHACCSLSFAFLISLNLSAYMGKLFRPHLCITASGHLRPIFNRKILNVAQLCLRFLDFQIDHI